MTFKKLLKFQDFISSIKFDLKTLKYSLTLTPDVVSTDSYEVVVLTVTTSSRGRSTQRTISINSEK